MVIIKSLHLYPIKGCAGIGLASATLGRAGLEWQGPGPAAGIGDREWMVVDAASGQFLSQRQLPRMALIVPVLGESGIEVTAPGQSALALPLADFALRHPETTVTVWNHECRAFDEGAQVNGWFSAFLGRAVRL